MTDVDTKPDSYYLGTRNEMLRFIPEGVDTVLEVGSWRDRGEHKAPAEPHAQRERLTFVAAGSRHRIETDHGAREGSPGSVLQHDALNGPSLDATGDSQQNERAQHVALLAMTAAAFEAWSSLWLICPLADAPAGPSLRWLVAPHLSTAL